ncbi:MAG: hypothetical protein HKN87_15065 [Saprospiraceae bacterium]|nr:hypothetical protein [Saprospiraceae bacterium]
MRRDKSILRSEWKKRWLWQSWLCWSVCLLFSIDLSAQKVSVDDRGEMIVELADGSVKKYEITDSSIFREGRATNGNVHPSRYDYRTFQRYAVAAIKYETEMLSRLQATQSEYDDLNDRVLQAKAAEDSEKLALLEHELSKKSWRLRDDRRILSYARRLIKNILRIGKQEKYHKLVKVYVPGLERVGRDLVTESFTPRETSPDSVLQTHKFDSDMLPSWKVRDAKADHGTELIANPVSIAFASALNRRPPVQKCSFYFEGKDELTGKVKTELSPELWFSFTDPRLKPHLKEQEFLSCAAYLSSLDGGFRYLTLKIDIYALNAKHSYGYIPEGSLLNIRLIDGKTVALFSSSESRGSFNKEDTKVTFLVQYPIDYHKERQLIRHEVDEVRLIWSSGYEDYQVTNVDLLVHQFECLNKK